MLPPIGSISMLAGQGRPGVIVDARPLGEAEGGRQLVALRVKARESRSEAAAGNASQHSASLQDRSTAAPKEAPNGSLPADGTERRSGPASARLLDQLSAAGKADVAKLQQRDQQVRQEEKAHAAVA
ncbi:MAG: hypothetical protein ACR2Q4_18510, partial [Geminicoccaceae bacterium]